MFKKRPRISLKIILFFFDKFVDIYTDTKHVHTHTWTNFVLSIDQVVFAIRLLLTLTKSSRGLSESCVEFARYVCIVNKGATIPHSYRGRYTYKAGIGIKQD